MSAPKPHWSARIAGCLLLILSMIPATTRAQSAKAILTGSVADFSGAALTGATITLSSQGGSAVSDAQGEFQINNIDPGTYTLTASYVGFRTYQTEVKIAAGQSQHLTLTLEVASQKDEVIVTAPRASGEAAAINQTRTADNILQVLPASVITSLPNANVADAIGRFPSVTLYRIEGEGVYVQVRGTEPRLTNITVDGITVPAPEPMVRQVRLDVIPSDMVDAIELNKTLSANQDADGIGGSINLRTKAASERPTYTMYTNGGYTPILDGRAAAAAGGTAGQRFGAGKRFGVLVNGSYDYNGRGIDNIQPALDPLSSFSQPFYDNNTIREYRYYRYRYGIDGSADYKFNEASSIYAVGLYSDLKDWGDKWYYEPQSTALSCPSSAAGACAGGANVVLSSSTASSPAPKFYTSSKRPNASVGTLILGGRYMGSKS